MDISCRSTLRQQPGFVDFAGICSRLFSRCVTALALVVAVSAAEFQRATPRTTTESWQATRYLVPTNAPNLMISRNGGGVWSYASNGQMLAWVQNISGNGPGNGNPPLTFPFGGNSVDLMFRWNTDNATIFTLPMTVPASSLVVSYASTENKAGLILPTWNVTFEPGTSNTSVTSPEDQPVVPVYESGLFMFQNITGVEQEMQFGDEVLKLEPGMNSIPYHSKLDEYGFPVDLPIGFDGIKKLDADGKPYIVATLRNGIEYSTEWSAMSSNAIEIFPPTGTAGATIKAPGSNGDPVYNQLPQGMFPSMGNPFPGGLALGTVGLPAGMTPGVNGALPSGTASGGTGSLPFGVSPGVFPNPFPDGQTLPPSGIRPPGTRTTDPGVVPGTPKSPPPPPAPGGTSGGTSLAGGGTVIQTDENDQEASGSYSAGSNMAGARGQATQLGEAGANEVSGAMSGALDGIGQAVSNPLGQSGGQFWTAPGEGFFDGFDRSWINFSVNNIPHLGSMNFELPERWITLVRAILLWVIRIYFVFGCIKLVMK